MSYRNYPLKTSIIVNDKEISAVIISDHYELNHNSYMNDEIILSFVKELHNSSHIIYKSDLRRDNGKRWESFITEPFYINHRAFKLIWYLEEDSNFLWVLNCYRRKNYDKK